MAGVLSLRLEEMINPLQYFVVGLSGGYFFGGPISLVFFFFLFDVFWSQDTRQSILKKMFRARSVHF